MISRAHQGKRVFAALVTGTALLPSSGHAVVPDAGLGQALVFGAGAVVTPENGLALLAVGALLGAARVPAKAYSVTSGPAALCVGVAAGFAFGAPYYLEALIAGAAAAIAALMAIGVRTAGAVNLCLAAVAALFGLGIGSILRIGDASWISLAAYALAAVGGAIAVTALGAALGRTLRQRREGMVRGLGAWIAVVAALVLVNATLERQAERGSAADLRAGSRVLSDEEIPGLVGALLEQVYFAFEQQDEDEIYDALAAVAADDVLADLYLQKRAALSLQEDGRRSDVQSVELERTEADPLPGAEGYRVHGVWSVRGSVIHWSHVHDRVNRYEADLAIVPVDGAWKIGAFDLIDVVRDDPPR
ncbi:hypothetical protein [Roseitranquillus sediminis]|uniref:hypothetical protein n=1 Tax=Roseitranquillus sediminis TaxID=2809051 RepID=UPI001D0C774E|nr:hypothetical protein [Roseitranquillus sediminis]MBM9596027.1 hypothetical protein [Roseitranquillus sediminis]